MTVIACQGCAKAATDFQCPLCQAENQPEQGFYCSQDCFAADWSKHRNAFHKSGVVREKKRPTSSDASATDETSKKRSRESREEEKASKRKARIAESRKVESESDAGEEEDEEKPMLLYVPWPPFPTATKASLITPPIDPKCPRAVVGAAADDTPLESMWPQVVAAAHCVAQSLPQHADSKVLVVAGDVRSAHAFAWAARCCGLASRLRMAVNAAQTTAAMLAAADDDDEAAPLPSLLFSTQRPIVVATSSVVRAVGGADANGGSGAAALWLTDAPGSLLVALPDVVDAGDLQGVRTRAIFFVARHAKPVRAATPRKAGQSKSPSPKKGTSRDEEPVDVAAGTAGAAAAWAVDESITHTVASVAELDALLPQPSDFPAYGLSLSWQPMPSLDNILEDDASSSEADDTASVEEKNGGKAGVPLASAAADPAANDEQLYTVSRQQCISDKLDNDLATSLASGDTAGATQHLIRIYSSDPGYFEEVFFNAMCCDWGAMSVAHAHHRLALVTRRLVDASSRFAAKKGASLADAALRAATRLVDLLPPMLPGMTDSDEVAQGAVKAAPKEAAKADETSDAQPAHQPTARERQDCFNYYNTSLPNIQLQATICYLFDIAPTATLDAFADAWGVSSYLSGPKALQAANAARPRLVERIESRYSARLDKPYAAYLLILAHLLYDTVAMYSLTTVEVDARLLWSLTLAWDAGPLTSFLSNCFLLQDTDMDKDSAAAKGSGKKAVKALSSRGTAVATNSSSKQNRIDALRVHEVRTAKAADYIRLPWKAFPLSGQRAREIARLQQTAVEEILMAMPREPRPMYIGDVGNLIGKWFAFNARFDGVLGVSLSDFLSKHPTEFQLAGRLVTRRKAGKSEQVKVRFATDGLNGDDSDDDGEGAARSRKARDRQLLTGSSKSNRKKAAEAREKDLPARARKKRAVKAFNKERFNRNYKPIDPSARVPGYVKRGPRRITGRGKKPNKRVVKRG